MTVAQNVGYGLMVRGVRRAEIRQRVRETLELVALGDFAARHPAQLSGGQQQRVALARAIICRPRLILLDEPLGALDAELRRQMQRFLKKLQREIGITFLFITHDQEEAITMADRICVMRDGRIVQVDVPAAIYYRPGSEYVARFFGDNNLIPGVLAEREGGVRWLRTPIGRFALPTEAGEAAEGPAGQAAMLVVRPEAIRLAEDDPTLSSRLSARVQEVSFVGPVSQVLLQARGGDGPPLMAKLPSRAEGLSIAAGQEIEIGWRLVDTHAVLA
jgi:spermidine/putrescine transport system ATP-binding protein